MTAADSSPQEVLRDEILADARKQADRVRRRAERDAKAIVKKARDEVEAERDARLAEARARADRTRDVVMARVPVDVARMRLERLEEALEAIHDAARRRLAERDGFDYREVVARRAAEALAAMEGEEFVFRLAPADRATLADWLPGEAVRRAGREGLRVRVDEAPGDFEAGILVRDATGRQVWDNSFEARLERLWPGLRREIGGRLLATLGKSQDKEP